MNCINLLFSSIRRVIECVSDMNANVLCMACGSYRRGESTCGDVDILIGPPQGINFVGILPSLIKRLHDIGFLTADLAVPSTTETLCSSAVDKDIRMSYMGVCKLFGSDAKFRRIDIKEYSKYQYPFALLYFTGSDIFNRY